MGNYLSLMGIVIIAVFTFVALLGYLISPDSTPMSNEMSLQLVRMPPGFTATILKVRKNEKEVESNIIEQIMYGKSSDYRVFPIQGYRIVDGQIIVEEFTDKGAGSELTFNLVDVVFPLSYNEPFIADGKGNYEIVTVTDEKISISEGELKTLIEAKNILKRKYWLGTDTLGRDLLSRLMLGTRVSLAVGLISVFISLVIGVVVGAIGGYYKGFVDDIVVWVINVVWSIPTLLLVIAITLILGKGFLAVFTAVGLTMWVEVARVVRGQVLIMRELEYVEAGRALGFTNMRILFRHILPNVMGPVIVISAANFAHAILMEAGLSFLGIGTQPPTPSWGSMIKDNHGYIIVDAAYLAILPGVAIVLMVLAFMIVGNGLRDALDSKSSEGVSVS